MLFIGFVLPIATYFFVGFGDMVTPLSRERGISALWQQMLGPVSMGCLLPVAVFSWLALGRSVYVPAGSKPAWVGAGLIAGAILGASFGVLVALGPPYGELNGFVAGWVAANLALLLRWQDQDRDLNWIDVSSVLAVLLGCLGAVLAPAFIFVPFLAAPWTLSACCVVEYRRTRSFRSGPGDRRAQAAAGLGLTAGFGAAFWKALDVYEKLPETRQGGCYVATAAAQGIPWIVRSKPVPTAFGVRRVNRQLRVLKAGEIALMTALPSLHRRLRRIYNAIGPALASGLNTPAKASIAYLLLAPLSLVVEATLRLSCPGIGARIARLYSGSSSPPGRSAT